jgi:hypothetical protein
VKYAVLRGILLAMPTWTFAIFVVEVTVLLDGGTWTEMLLESIAMGAFLGLEVGVIGFCAHPAAKPTTDRYAPRFLAGSLVGMGTAIVAASASALGCKILGVLPTDPQGWGWGGWNEIQHLAVFVIAGMGAAAFAASVVGALLAPSAYMANGGRPMIRYCAWVSTLGAIAGAWIGGGAGLVVVNVSK